MVREGSTGGEERQRLLAAGGGRRWTGVDGRAATDGEQQSSNGRAADLDRRWTDLIRRSLLTARALAGRTMGTADDPGNDRTNTDVGESGLQMGFWIQRLLADVACLLDFPTARGGRNFGCSWRRTNGAAADLDDADGCRTEQEAGCLTPTDDGLAAGTNRRRWQASDGRNGAYLDSGGASRWMLMADGVGWQGTTLFVNGRKRRAYLDLGRRSAALGFAGSQDDYG
ncbi:hypothetical protein ACLOJK_037981 [Asimina triloba]